MRSLRLLAAVVALHALVGCGGRVVRGGADGSADDNVVPVDVPLPPPVDVPLPPPVDIPPPPPLDVPFPPDLLPPPPDVQPPPVDVPRGTTCMSPQVLPGGVRASFSLDTFTERETRTPCGSTVGQQGGPIHWIRTTVAAGQQLVVTGVRGTSSNPLFRLYDSCATVACLANGVSAGTGSTLRWTNAAPMPREVLLAVSADITGRVDSFAVTVDFVSPAANGACMGATALTPGTPVLAQDLALGREVPTACAGDTTAPLAARWYRVNVPAGQYVDVRATLDPTTGTRGNVALRVMTGCMGMCLTSNATTLDGRTTTVRWSNTSMAAREVFVALSPISTALLPVVDVSATLGTPPSNLTCARATPVMNGTTLRAQDAASATERQNPCPGMPGAAHPVLFYSATVPAGQTLVVTATPNVTGRGAPNIRVIPDCSSPFCYAASTTAGTSSSAVFANTTMGDQRVIITVGYTTASQTVPFDLGVSIRPPATNSVCARATRVMNGTNLVGENLSDARELPRACPVPGRDGPVLYYAVRVGAGEQLIVTAQRVDGTFTQPLLRLTDGCTSGVCVASSANMAVMTSGTARLSYVNSTASAQELIVTLGNGDASPTPAGRITLSVSVARPPYTISMISPQCDDMTGATVLPEAVGDDTGASSVPLAFPFAFFGEAQTSWSASTNGYLQLWPTGGRSTGALGAAELPSASAPTRMVAAFWDDLEIRAESSVRWREVAMPRRHVTVEWNNAGFCCGSGSPDHVTFQAKLFVDNTIEYHYCRLDASARALGSAASIGLQDGMALRGVSYAARRMNAVNVMTAIRFTP